MELVTISTYTFPYEMAVHKSKLEAYGIETFTQDELTVQVHNFYSSAIGGVKLQVKQEDVKRAKDILAEENDLKVDYPDSKLNCTICNSGNVDGIGLNGKISMVILILTGLPIPVFSNKYHCYDCHQDFKIKK